jgi:Fe-Mn family superoxide dismutase
MHMFELPDLPYAYDALQPVISDKTLHFHHDKHHAAYVKTVNELTNTAADAGKSLEDVVRGAVKAGNKKLCNNAAQAWNHAFFWESMTPIAGPPPSELAAAIAGAFGDLKGLKEKFVAEGAAHFGSGWVWLVSDAAGKLEVRSTHDADDTLTNEGATPLIVCDLWEHAYYLDHQNDRKGFLEAWFDRLPNWAFAARQYAAVRGAGETWRYPAPMAEPDRKRA